LVDSIDYQLLKVEEEGQGERQELAAGAAK